MPDGRTPEHDEADAQLAAAIDRCFRVYSGDKGDKYVVGDYVVLTSVQCFTDDGILVTRYPMYMTNGDLPWYRVFGLMDVHRSQSEGELASNDNG